MYGDKLKKTHPTTCSTGDTLQVLEYLIGVLLTAWLCGLHLINLPLKTKCEQTIQRVV